MRTFNGLIARAAVAADGGIGGHGDFIVHRNVMGVHVINVNAVPILPQRRMLLNIAHVGVPVPQQPVIPDEDLSPNGD